MSEYVKFTVYGKPQPAGSKRGFVNPKTGGVIITDAAKGSRQWKQEVASRASEAMGDRPLMKGPVSLRLAFLLVRPKSHYGTGRNADRVKLGAPLYPTVKPDATKLLRAVEDAMTGIVWRDDSQVVSIEVTKTYSTRYEVHVTATERSA